MENAGQAMLYMKNFPDAPSRNRAMDWHRFPEPLPMNLRTAGAAQEDGEVWEEVPAEAMEPEFDVVMSKKDTRIKKKKKASSAESSPANSRPSTPAGASKGAGTPVPPSAKGAPTKNERSAKDAAAVKGTAVPVTAVPAKAEPSKQSAPKRAASQSPEVAPKKLKPAESASVAALRLQAAEAAKALAEAEAAEAEHARVEAERVRAETAAAKKKASRERAKAKKEEERVRAEEEKARIDEEAARVHAALVQAEKGGRVPQQRRAYSARTLTLSQLGRLGVKIRKVTLLGGVDVFAPTHQWGIDIKEEEVEQVLLEASAQPASSKDMKFKVVNVPANVLAQWSERGYRICEFEPQNPEELDRAVYTLTAHTKLPSEDFMVIDTGAQSGVLASATMTPHYTPDPSSKVVLTAYGGQRIHPDSVGSTPALGAMAVWHGATKSIGSVPQICKATPGVRMTFDHAGVTVDHPKLHKPIWGALSPNNQYLLSPSDLEPLEALHERGDHVFQVDSQPVVVSVSGEAQGNARVAALGLSAHEVRI